MTTKDTKNRKYHTVYKTTNLLDGKIYIGSHSTDNLNDGYMGSGYHLVFALKKYGVENFHKEILFVYDNPIDMNEKEKSLVTKEFCLREDTYNIALGGGSGYLKTMEHNPFFGKKHSEETRRKMSEKAKARVRRPCSEETKRKIAEKVLGRNLGRKASEETRRKMSETHKKNYAEGKRTVFPKYGTENPFYGKKHSEEALRKNREKTLGKKWVNNGTTRKQVTTEELSEYLSNGWVRGRGTV